MKLDKLSLQILNAINNLEDQGESEQNWTDYFGEINRYSDEQIKMKLDFLVNENFIRIIHNHQSYADAFQKKYITLTIFGKDALEESTHYYKTRKIFINLIWIIVPVIISVIANKYLKW